MWQISKDAATALFWARALMYGAIFTSVSYFHLVLVYLGLDKRSLYRIILVAFYAVTALFLVANTTPYFVASVGPQLFFKFWPAPGLLYTPFLVMFAIQVGFASILLLRAYRHASGIERKQNMLLLVGLFLAFVGGSTNYFLWYKIPIPPYGNILVSVYVVLTAYAILKYHLLDMKIIATEIFTAMIVMIFSAEVFLSKSILEGVLRAIGLSVVIFFCVLLVRSVRTEVKRREEMERLSEELEIAYDKLKEVDQAKTDFLSLASHQLRSPLTVIKVGLGALLDGVFGQVRVVKQRDAMKTIITSADRLVNLIGEYLDISRIELGRMEYNFVPGDLSTLVTALVGEYTQRAEVKGLQLTCKAGKELPKISFDSDKMRQVITNLIDNAIKYTPAGTISVSCVVEAIEGRTSVVVAVSDSGRGLSKEDMGLIFQKFKRASGKSMRMRDGEPVEGSGLGLYVAKMFVEAHKGKIWAESKGLGKGTVFKLAIPISK